MNKTLTKKLISLAIVISMTICSLFSISASAINENEKNKMPGFVSSEFVFDVKTSNIINEKHQIALKYYKAKMTKDEKSAKEALDEYKLNYSNENPDKKSIINSKIKNNIYSLTYNIIKELIIPQCPQDTNFYCGYAALQSLLSYCGITKTQNQIATATYNTTTALPWYKMNGDDISQFPAATYLTAQLSVYYTPFPYGAAGTVTTSIEDLKADAFINLDCDYGFLVCGESKAIGTSHITGYPSSIIRHWLVVDGYQGDNVGDVKQLHIVDPAKSPAISWSGSIQAKYWVDISTIHSYSSTRGWIS